MTDRNVVSAKPPGGYKFGNSRVDEEFFEKALLYPAVRGRRRQVCERLQNKNATITSVAQEFRVSQVRIRELITGALSIVEKHAGRVDGKKPVPSSEPEEENASKDDLRRIFKKPGRPAVIITTNGSSFTGMVYLRGDESIEVLPSRLAKKGDIVALGSIEKMLVGSHTYRYTNT